LEVKNRGRSLGAPAPERFVLHKLYSSQMRRAHPGKGKKDLEQAAALRALAKK
jgi:hypothetical protein